VRGTIEYTGARVGAVEPFDPTRPNVARVWDYWLGGKDNFAADRELGEKLLAIHPASAQMARENRAFLQRAVRYVAGQGVEQFVDVGAGLPTALNTHDVAHAVDPRARVAYVDNDPVVIAHGRTLLARSPSVIVVPGDVRDPRAVLADAELTGLIDLAEPTCVILSAILHFSDAATARDIASVFVEAMSPGSYLVVSVGSGAPQEGNRFASAYTAARIHIHSREELRTFFGDLDLVPPGVVPVRCWPGDGATVERAPRTATFLCGVARKP
jgi:O-methyltransferase involved in polyketide biosynthesis